MRFFIRAMLTRYFMKALLIVLLLSLGACSVPRISPYKIDIQQGNVVTQEMVSQLKPGMTKSQVRFVMGTPLITDIFHKDRWDYVYRNAPGGRLEEERRVTLIFENDLLKRVEGDVTPAKPKVDAPSAPTPREAGTAAPAASK